MDNRFKQYKINIDNYKCMYSDFYKTGLQVINYIFKNRAAVSTLFNQILLMIRLLIEPLFIIPHFGQFSFKIIHFIFITQYSSLFVNSNIMWNTNEFE